MKKKSAKILAVGLICLLMYVAVPQVFGMTTLDNQTAASSNNIGDQDYHTWASCVYSYLYQSGDQFTRVEALSNGVVVETYDSEFKFLTTKTIPMDLELFGGFYAGDDYNFLVFGQTNPNEDNNKEVIRVVKYSKDWERLGYASLYGADTTVPFRAGSLRFAEDNGILYIRTSHEMYKSSDGLNHQSNLTFSVRQADMNLNNSGGYSYVSHSLNQFIMVDNDHNLITLDHGDGYPRSATLTKHIITNGEITDRNYVSALSFAGEVGQNSTGASLGGLSESASSYLVAGNSVIQDSDFISRNTRNIFVAVINKESFSADSTKLVWLTNYEEYSTDTSTPHLVKISDNRFLIMWTQPDSSVTNGTIDSEILYYVFIDGQGNQIGNIYTQKSGSLSDCAPILAGDEVIWYVTYNSTPIFYSVNISSGELTVTDRTMNNIAYINGYEDGKVRPEAQISREEVASIFYRLLTEESREYYETSVNDFSDVDSGRWSNTAISTLANAGVLNGYENGTFKPGNPISRAELVKIVITITGTYEWEINEPFTDVWDHWAYWYILSASNTNWITGYEDGTFKPDKYISRAEAMTIVNRVLGREDSDIEKITDMKTWSDNADTSKWYYKAVQIATNSY